MDVEVQRDPKGEAIYRLGEPFADAAEARKAAGAKSKELKRRSMTFSATIVGDPRARAGAPAIVSSGAAPGIDGHSFIPESAKHRYQKSGYLTDLSGEQKA